MQKTISQKVATKSSVIATAASKSNSQPIHINFSQQFGPSISSIDDIKRRLTTVFKQLESYLNTRTDLFYIDAGTDISKLQFRTGDLVVDATIDPNFITIYSFDGSNKKFISFQSFAGTLPEIANEIPSGTVNGSNKIFTTSQIFVFKSTRLFMNGSRQVLGIDYTEDSVTFQKVNFTTAPPSGAHIIIDYEIGSS